MEPSRLIALGVMLLIAAFLIWDHSRRKQTVKERKETGVLKTYTTDLTQTARDGQLDPVIGREEEIERVIHILSRRRKNNPLLIGEPGVGKTAVVEGLAWRIVKKECPPSLADKRVLVSDLTGLISGPKYRGEFEERMHQLTQELFDLGRTVILFIDEIHMIEQSSGSEGAKFLTR